MILKLGMKQWSYTNDPGMTLTYFKARSTLVAQAFEWGKLSKCHLKGKTLWKWANGLKFYDSEKKKKKKKWTPGTGLPPTRGQYTCILP